MVGKALKWAGATALVLLLTSCGGGSSSGGGTTGSAVPATPSSISATAGNGQVSLTWSFSNGATSYNLKRSTTSGSGYAVIASPATNSYVDTGLTNGTTYYYIVSAVDSAGESGNSGEVSCSPVAPPATPTALTATAGNLQVSLAWNASGGATSYHVKRSTTSGSGYTQVAAPTTTSYTDTGLTNGTPYYYVVSAVNNGGESGNSAQASATPNGTTTVHVTVNVLSNRHAISPYIYGGAYPKDAATVTDSGLSVVRWGGNATSTYNWQTKTYNADSDYFFEDFAASGFSTANADGDSVQFVQDVKTAGGNPLMTMIMLPWVAQSAEASSNHHWSFSVSKYGAQCHTDQYNPDAGDGIVTSSTCDSTTTPTYLNANPNDAYVPLLDDHNATCASGSNCVYRSDWAASLATAFGSAQHFYDMDNEIDIWGGTHRDIHPAPSGYNELRDTYLAEARALKNWDPQAIRLGPVSCCWWFYWNGANSADKPNHAGVDFLPWWLNEVYWQDQIAGTRSLDVVDIHAYPDGPTESTLVQKQALATRIYRDYWDPSYVSESSSINQPYTTQIQPNHTIPFRIPRIRALVNATYPGIPLAITEWSAEFAGTSDFSTALGDADAYGIFGRERVYLGSRWEAPDPANPNYQALKLFTNYDGQHHGFAPISVAASNDGDPNLFSSYAAVNAAGTSMTLLFLNKDPQNTVQVQFALNGFVASQMTTYTLLPSSPTSSVAASKAWSASMAFPPYSATLLVITGTSTTVPAAEWDLNPDTIMVAANGTVMLSPKITSGTGTVTLGTAQADSGIFVVVTSGTLTSGQNGIITVTAGSTPGFYHYSVSGTDSATATQQGGYIVVGNPAATFTKTGDGQSGSKGTALANPLTTTLLAGSSGGSDSGASVLFTTDGGSLSNGTTSGTKVIAVSNSAGVASVTLTLPATAGAVHVTAEGPYALGHPLASFIETAQ
jgi:fibronectin type 3 domain-containing protein